MRKASESNLNMGIQLGRATPCGLDADGALTLELEPGATSAVSFFQASENRQMLETFLRDETDNVRSVEIRQAPPPAATDKPAAPSQPQQALRAGITESEQERLKQDKGIAAVIHEFKGAIVDVKK